MNETPFPSVSPPPLQAFFNRHDIACVAGTVSGGVSDRRVLTNFTFSSADGLLRVGKINLEITLHDGYETLGPVIVASGNVRLMRTLNDHCRPAEDRIAS